MLVRRSLKLQPILIVAVAALAAPTQWRVDPNHSGLVFRVGHLGFSHVHGRFNTFEAEVMIDDERPEESSVKLTVDAASIDTGIERRDERLRGEMFFQVDQHPEVTFVSTKIEATAEREYEVTGDLTILGVTRPVTAKVTRGKTGPAGRDEIHTGFEATLTIDRTEFGMNAMPEVVANQVDLTWSVELIQQP